MLNKLSLPHNLIRFGLVSARLKRQKIEDPPVIIIIIHLKEQPEDSHGLGSLISLKKERGSAS
ncbi:hypothetical protein BRARA_G00380 [Brassica rapa]|uniref:Uncharacterized protein n=1 Tax=Brassica campestris TaxID=3711 RepID=A0A397YPJ9_BRACM|nr:hypothetical protein BRARA_G00380 [Brassica rapa]